MGEGTGDRTDEPWEPGAERLEEGRRILRRVEACCSPSEPLLYARLDFLLDDEGRLALNEAELIEPSLFFRHGPHAADRLAAAVCERVLT